MSCLTPEDLFNYPRCCNLTNQICCPHEGIQEALDCSIELISRVLGQDFCPVEECRLFDGTGSCKLYMNCELSELHSVTVKGCEESCECKKCEGKPELPCVSGSILEYTCKGDFPCGTKNIEVCGIWGSPMPAGIKKAIIFLAMETISPGVLGLNACNGVSSITWDDFSIRYTDNNNSAFTTGFLEIDQLLTPYINSDSQLFMGTTSDCACNKDDCKKCGGW